MISSSTRSPSHDLGAWDGAVVSQLRAEDRQYPAGFEYRRLLLSRRGFPADTSELTLPITQQDI